MSNKNLAKANLKTAQKIFKNINLAAMGEAVAAMMTSSTTLFASDCLMCTGLAKSLLEKHGIKADWVIGQAAWRVDGKHQGAVISNSLFNGGSYYIPENGGASGDARAFHAWLKLNEVWNLDITTFQLPMKMQKLDEFDGGCTPVTWKPTILLFKDSDISSFEKVRQSYNSGVFWYKEGNPTIPNPDFVTRKQEEAIDDDDVAMLELIYQQAKSGENLSVLGLIGSYEIKSSSL